MLCFFHLEFFIYLIGECGIKCRHLGWLGSLVAKSLDLQLAGCEVASSIPGRSAVK